MTEGELDDDGVHVVETLSVFERLQSLSVAVSV